MLESWALSLSSGIYFKFVFLTVLIGLSLITICHAVIYKRDSRSALGWFVFIAAAPILGVIGYFFLGLNRVQKKGDRLERLYPDENKKEFESKIDSSELGTLYRVGKKLAYSPVCSIDSIKKLDTGDEAYPEMLAAIRGAKKTIVLYSYIFEKDEAGNQFVEELISANSRGVQVRVLVDGLGSSSTLAKLGKSIKSENIPFAVFHPILWRPRFANLRNHRKILVVDEETAFVGGLNIAKTYWPKLAGDKAVLDYHFKLVGEIADYVAAVFSDDWEFAAGESLGDAFWGRSLLGGERGKESPSNYGRIVVGGPGKGFEKIQWHFVSAIHYAKESVKIITPYFIPSAEVTSALIAASLRGVRVEIILPKVSDSLVVTWAMHASLGELLSHGCEFYMSQPHFDHSKIFIVDDNYVSIGSANWDVRSFRLNFEMNAEISGEEVGASLSDVFEAKKSGSKRYLLSDHESRPFFVKLRGGFSRMLNPYL